MKKIISLAVVFVSFLSLYIFFNYFNNILTNNQIVEKVTVENQEQEMASEKIKILAIGDSLTAGYGLNITDSYPSQLEKKLLEKGESVEVINMGVSGETTAGLLERIEFIKKQKPELVLITIGGNDALRALPISETENNIFQIIKSLKEQVTSDKIFLANIQAPGNLGSNYTSKFNSIFAKVADSEKINLMQFVVPEVFTDETLMQGDGIHPNSEGYKLIIEKYILPQILQHID